MGAKRYLGKPLNSLLKRWDYEVTRSSGLQELRMLSLYSQFVKKSDLCFDIGANVGKRTDIFRKLVASVVAEPQYICVEKLNKKYGADSKVKIIGKAIEAYKGQITIGICTKDDEKSS